MTESAETIHGPGWNSPSSPFKEWYFALMEKESVEPELARQVWETEVYMMDPDRVIRKPLTRENPVTNKREVQAAVARYIQNKGGLDDEYRFGEATLLR